MRPGPGFAMLRRGRVTAAAEFAGRRWRRRPDARRRQLGQNRVAGTDFSSKSTDLDATVDRQRATVPVSDFRGDVITGRGGRQALVPDPAGNLVELFEPFT